MIPSENDLLGASQPLHSHNHLSSPLRSLSHSHTRTLPPLYISRISHSHIHTTTYIPDGPSAFWTFSFVFALRGRGNQQLEERVQQLSLLEDDWMEQRSNRINFVTSCGQKPHAQIYRKAYDGEQTCINGVKRLTEHGFLSSTLYLFFSLASRSLTFVFPGSVLIAVRLHILFSFHFCFLNFYSPTY
jgi:hypothetical protein